MGECVSVGTKIPVFSQKAKQLSFVMKILLSFFAFVCIFPLLIG